MNEGSTISRYGCSAERPHSGTLPLPLSECKWCMQEHCASYKYSHFKFEQGRGIICMFVTCEIREHPVVLMQSQVFWDTKPCRLVLKSPVQCSKPRTGFLEMLTVLFKIHINFFYRLRRQVNVCSANSANSGLGLSA
jgi:hypothetical protein